MAGAMVDHVVEKSAEDLRREIDELNRQQRELTERLRDPRGLRKGPSIGTGIRVGGTGAGPQRLLGRGLPQRGATRRGDTVDSNEQPPTKKRLLSAVVRVEGDDDATEPQKEEFDELHEEKDGKRYGEQEDDHKRPLLRGHGSGKRDLRGATDGDVGEEENHHIEPLPRVIPKIDDPNVAKRNRRMFGALLGTLEKFRQEDQKLSGSEAFMRRSTSQKRAEQRAQEESERLRQQEREQLAGKRKRDLVLRARLAAKAEEKQLELLFLQWTDHHKKLCSFLRTKDEPGIFYMPAKPSEETEKLLEGRKEELAEWKTKCRAELTEYQRQATEEHLTKVEVDIERWQSGTHLGNVNDAPSSTGYDIGDGDGVGDDERDPRKHGWRESRVSDTKGDQREDVMGDGALLGVVMEDNDQEEVVDRKEREEPGALKDVRGYGSGDDDDIEDR